MHACVLHSRPAYSRLVSDLIGRVEFARQLTSCSETGGSARTLNYLYFSPGVGCFPKFVSTLAKR